MGNYVLTEHLVEKCCQQRSDKIRVTRANRYSELDQDGTDFILEFKVQNPLFPSQNGKGYFFPLSMRLQVKTSTNGETVGLVLPPQDFALPSRLAAKLKKNMIEKIDQHRKGHPHVPCLLFVGTFRREDYKKIPKKEEQILEEIWVEIKRMFEHIQRTCRFVTL